MKSKKYLFLICLFLLSSFCIPKNIAMAQEEPRYPQNHGGMEILADAPWRVSNSNAIIPIEVVIKDAPCVSDCDKGIHLTNITIYDGVSGKKLKMITAETNSLV